MMTLYWYNGDLEFEQEKPRFETPPVYEVIRVIDGEPLFFQEHMIRLYHSLKLVHLIIGYDEITFYKAIKKLVVKTELENNNFRIEIGINKTGNLGCLIFPVPSFYPTDEMRGKGVTLSLGMVVRQNPHAKVFYETYQDQINQLKAEKNAYEIVLHDSSGKLSEGSRSNIFFVKNKTLYSAKSKDILLGITREKIIEVLKTLKFELVEQDIYVNEITQFDACFMSGTSVHVLPIRSIDHVDYLSVENPVIQALVDGFGKTVSRDIETTRRLYND
ncbi:aminotransferase class IV [Fusibacter tunisiensis]|uniref:Branched-chain amino acid aminotransferase n=1 Tax=Fusibacter tunisiensis TaxID=1008308 RepID=A0ABS2MSB8_9FIRM|nr:aminotransferase class IV [Fusibacter tunisiensis]MBM7562311.1 branched-chain amino acid aminotransferase [Fusibacter tunisiensis]